MHRAAIDTDIRCEGNGFLTPECSSRTLTGSEHIAMLGWHTFTDTYRTTRDSNRANACVIVGVSDSVITSSIICVAIALFPYIIVIGRFRNQPHIAQLTAAIYITFDCAIIDSHRSSSFHLSGFSKCRKAFSTSEDVTIRSRTWCTNRATRNLYVSIVLYKSAFATAIDITLDSTTADSHISSSNQG